MLKVVTTCCGMVSIVEFIALPPLSVQLIDQVVYFVNPPRLISTATTSNKVSAPAIYYFTIAIPEDAGEPLQQIRLKQVSGGQVIRYNLQRTQAFEGVRSQLGATLPLQVTSDDQDSTLSVIFTPPLAPGRTLTLALRPGRNPDAEGVYFLGVSVIPAGENVSSQFIGFGRFQFRRSGED